VQVISPLMWVPLTVIHGLGEPVGFTTVMLTLAPLPGQLTARALGAVSPPSAMTIAQVRIAGGVGGVGDFQGVPGPGEAGKV
jgi:hypothetical protein